MEDEASSEQDCQSEEFQRFEALAKRLLTAPEEQAERVKQQSKKKRQQPSSRVETPSRP